MKRHLVLLFCLLQPAVLEAQTPDPKPKTSCTVQGKVVQEPGRTPLRKADIVLVSVGDDAEGRPDRTTTANQYAPRRQ